jgi:hypothetical protein
VRSNRFKFNSSLWLYDRYNGVDYGADQLLSKWPGNGPEATIVATIATNMGVVDAQRQTLGISFLLGSPFGALDPVPAFNDVGPGKMAAACNSNS